MNWEVQKEVLDRVFGKSVLNVCFRDHISEQINSIFADRNKRIGIITDTATIQPRRTTRGCL